MISNHFNIKMIDKIKPATPVAYLNQEKFKNITTKNTVKKIKNMFESIVIIFFQL